MWHDGLWLKLWDMGVKGRMWCVIKNMHEASRSDMYIYIIESVDAICRDGADTPISPIHK